MNHIKCILSILLAIIIVIIFYRINLENRTIILNDKFSKNLNDNIKINDKCFKYK